MNGAGNVLIQDIDGAKSLPLEQWFDHLIWCPSQCYYHIQYKGKDYILYLRWRWEDPWQAHVIKNAASLEALHGDKPAWSEDVFLLNHVAFRDEELDQAKAKLIDLFLRNNGEFPERMRTQRSSTISPNNEEQVKH
jgi:hypothetical protein